MRAMLLLACMVTACRTAAGSPPSDQAPLVLELFTSQGCSSCPPADRLLSRLAHAGNVNGRAIIPLAFHVDYWNDLGWADPFSLPAWTARQQAYARALGDRSVYTPELVAGGAIGVVGNSTSAVEAAIARAPAQQPITATARWSPTELTVEATAPAGADVWVAVWQDGTRTAVPRGENAGTELVGDRVVRRLERVARAGHDGTITIPIGPWPAGGAVAFAQRPDQVIVGATLLPH
jgi:hypothetical protein